MPRRAATESPRTLLLRAALDRGPAGTEAFGQWRSAIDLTAIDYPSQRLLPSIRRHLVDDDALSRQVQNVLRFTWLRSQILISAAGSALAELAEAGVPTMLIKGGAVLHHNGWHIADRPMEDIDIVVPSNHLRPAVAAMERAGFNNAFAATAASRPERVRSHLHAIAFEGPLHAEVDLHWRVYKQSRRPGADDSAWRDSVAGSVRDAGTRVLGRDDTLLQVIANGANENDGSALQWAIDAVELIEGAKIDWDHVRRQARLHRLSRACHAGLALLHEFRSEDVPAGLVRQFRHDAGREAAWQIALPPRLSEPIRTAADRVPHARRLTPTQLWLAQRGRRAEACAPSGEPDPPVHLGETVGFACDGASGPAPYLTRGWYFAESGGSWSSERRPLVSVPLATPTDEALSVRARLQPFLAPSSEAVSYTHLTLPTSDLV